MKYTWDLPDPFIMEMSVAGEDIDGLGHANNASYVVWCEQTAWQHSESLGLSIRDYQRLDRAVAIQEATYRYFSPGFAGDRLGIGTWLVACDGKLRLERRFQVVNLTTGAVLMRGHWKLVAVILSSGKATRLPREFLDVYQSALVSQEI